MYPRPIADAGASARLAYGLSLPLALLVWLLPLAAVLLTSVRSLADLNAGNYWGRPSTVEFGNYVSVFADTPMARYFVNSLVVTVPTVMVTLLVSAMAGTALALYRFRGNVLLFAMFVAGNFVPFQILLVPVRSLMVGLGMYDSYGALILFHIAFQTGFCTLFLRNFIRALPFELIEAARVSGLSEFGIFWRIVLPLVRPALAALAVLTFTFVWNDFFWGLVLVQSDEVRPITVGLQSLKGQWIASWQLISAGSIVAALPPVALFFLMQRHFIAGLTLGASKG